MQITLHFYGYSLRTVYKLQVFGYQTSMICVPCCHPFPLKEKMLQVGPIWWVVLSFYQAGLYLPCTLQCLRQNSGNLLKMYAWTHSRSTQTKTHAHLFYSLLTGFDCVKGMDSSKTGLYRWQWVAGLPAIITTQMQKLQQQHMPLIMWNSQAMYVQTYDVISWEACKTWWQVIPQIASLAWHTVIIVGLHIAIAPLIEVTQHSTKTPSHMHTPMHVKLLVTWLHRAWKRTILQMGLCAHLHQHVVYTAKYQLTSPASTFWDQLLIHERWGLHLLPTQQMWYSLG